VNKKIKIHNKNYVQHIIKANNKNYNLQYKPTPILNGEYELDSYNGKLLQNYTTLNSFNNHRYFYTLEKVLEEQEETIQYVKRMYK
tara:strand:- start:249 stop:506 length:258 start_codon:yes stop_codon:yes gene_type:complete